MHQEIKRILPAEWYSQSAIQIAWPHSHSDWSYMIDEVVECYVEIIRQIAIRQRVIVVCPETAQVLPHLKNCNLTNVSFFEIPTNDTWARDFGGITLLEDSWPVVCDFQFNGWGKKFSADLDNRVTAELFRKGAFVKDVDYRDYLDFVLEGGSIESDGKGTLLTTEQCLLSKNRNDSMDKEEIEEFLKNVLGVDRVLWLANGALDGDDTDSHIDTLARFGDEKTIAYVKCEDPEDVHFKELDNMEQELKNFRTMEGDPYNLLALPMADPVYDEEDGHRLPATYANFLIMNDAVLVPFYNSSKDEVAKDVLQTAFPDREIVGVNCLPLIKQHGSLHCITMQYPEGTIL